MNISEFDKGEVIVITQPSKPFGPSKSVDRGYIGVKMTYLGIANGLIYLRIEQNVGVDFIDNDNIRELAMDIWDEGWEKWVDPDTLINEPPKKTRAELIAKIDIAISTEDYEEADVLKKELDALTNNK